MATDRDARREARLKELNKPACCIQGPHASEETPCYDRYDKTTWSN